MENIRQLLERWSSQTASFSKLQHAYAFIAIVALLIAGVVGLMDYRLGQSLLFLSLFSLVIFVSNGVIWALIRTFLMNQPKSNRSTAPKKK